jgi:putative addiction module component (TIGR02574 family)
MRLFGLRPRGLLAFRFVATLQTVTQAVAKILQDVEHLSVSERAELADRLMEVLSLDVSPEIEPAFLEELRRRDAEIESGAVTPIPGDQVMAKARRVIEGARRAT